MTDLTDALREMVESSAPPVSLDEAAARPISSPTRPPSRRPILVAFLAVIVSSVAVGLVVHAASDTGTTTPATSSVAVKPVVPTSTTPVEPAFSADTVASAGASNVWVLGGTSEGARRLFHSADGGRGWDNATPAGLPPHGDVTGVFAIDDKHVLLSIIGEPDAQNAQAAILRTADSGRTWTRTAIIGADTAHFSFIDSSRGWLESSLGAAAGSEGVDIYRTLDGGVHWQLMSRGATPSGAPGTPGALTAGCDKTGITFLDAATGFATGACAGDGEFLYVTHDAGRTWKPVPIHGSQSIPTGDGTEITPPAFSGRDGAAWLAAGKTDLAITTTDRGSTWSVKTLSGATLGYPADVADATHWWFVVGTHIEYTADAGGHFTVRSSPSARILFLQFTSQSSGWAISDHGLLYATNDGARTWRLVTP
jgi:photosystem II stability/assembly factor-like uncharacterized protein